MRTSVSVNLKKLVGAMVIGLSVLTAQVAFAEKGGANDGGGGNPRPLSGLSYDQILDLVRRSSSDVITFAYGLDQAATDPKNILPPEVKKFLRKNSKTKQPLVFDIFDKLTQSTLRSDSGYKSSTHQSPWDVVYSQAPFKINYLRSGSCFNEKNEATTASVKPGTLDICLSYEELVKKTSTGEMNFTIPALLVHEIAHLVGLTHDEANVVQDLVFESLWTANGTYSKANDLSDFAEGYGYEFPRIDALGKIAFGKGHLKDVGNYSDLARTVDRSQLSNVFSVNSRFVQHCKGGAPYLRSDNTTVIENMNFNIISGHFLDPGTIYREQIGRAQFLSQKSRMMLVQTSKTGSELAATCRAISEESSLSGQLRVATEVSDLREKLFRIYSARLAAYKDYLRTKDVVFRVLTEPVSSVSK